MPSKTTARGNESKTGPCRISAFVQFAEPGPPQRLLLIFDRQYAVADTQAMMNTKIHQSPRRFIGDNLEMIGFTTQDTAKRDIAVKMLAGTLARLGRK